MILGMAIGNRINPIIYGPESTIYIADSALLIFMTIVTLIFFLFKIQKFFNVFTVALHAYFRLG